MDRLAALRLFVTVAEAGSLSAAGRKLGMPLYRQPAFEGLKKSSTRA